MMCIYICIYVLSSITHYVPIIPSPFSGSNGSPGGVIFGMMDSVFTCGMGGNGNTEAWLLEGGSMWRHTLR